MCEQVDKAIRFVDYLLRVASLRTKVVRDVLEYDRTLWISSIPHEKGCFTEAWGREEDHDSDVWIEIQNQPEPELPGIPHSCRDWVLNSSLRNKNTIPNLLSEITRQIKNSAWQQESDQPEFIAVKERIENHPEIQKAWDRYLEEHWSPWVQVHNVWESVHNVYSLLFAIHQDQLRLGEEYELILGIGFLTWQTPNGQRVRRHMIVANALLEFESRLGKFTVQPNPDGANIRPELDMLDIDNQPVHAEEVAKSSLSHAGDDPWDKDCVEGVLKSLVHSINPEGEFKNGLKAEVSRASEKPIIEYAPALILRKRSTKGLTETLKRIKERIEAGEDIPREFRDLAEVQPRNESSISTEPGDTTWEFDGEVFFPKLSNEEQRRIVNKIRESNGVLVQGPPGTGKSHTIANLICHLLATGQRTLITAKTPRALQVLEGLVPEELRSLCINLLGSGLEEKRSLESSVGGILRKNEEWNGTRASQERTELEKKLFQLREEKAKVERKLREIRESETHILSVANGTYRGTAARIAEAVNRDREIYKWFTDKVPLDSACPILEKDLRSLLSALRWLTPQKRQELNLVWPVDSPSPENFSHLVDLEKKIAQEEANLIQMADEQIACLLSSADIDAIQTSMDSLTIFKNERQRLLASPYQWMKDALCDIISGNLTVWQEILRITHDVIIAVEALVSIADGKNIDFPDEINIQTLLEDVCKLKEYCEKGGKLGWGPFRPKIAKERIYILKNVRVNGLPCSTLERLTILADILHVHVECEKGWRFWTGRYEAPKGPYALQLHAFKSLKDALEAALSIENIIEQSRKKLKECHILSEPTWTDETQIEKWVASCRLAIVRIRKRGIDQEIGLIESSIATVHSKNNAHPVASDMLHAIRKRDIDEYSRSRARIDSLEKERQYLRKIEEYIIKLRRIAPKLTEDLEQNHGSPCWNTQITQIKEAWNWARARFWIEEYIQKEDTLSFSKRAKQIEDETNSTIAKLAAIHAWTFCFSRLEDSHRRHMEAWQQSMRRLGKGTGKHAPRHRREAQKHLNECREAVPAWVMPLHRIWDAVEPAPGMFDVIIVDEASQCGFEAIPLFYLAKKILIVGDDKQISPEEGFIDKNVVFQLMEQFLYDFDFKDSFHRDASLFDHAKRMYGTHRITLREHFRCMPEIIRFSNDLCYFDTPLIPLRQYGPDRVPPVEHVFVEGGYREGDNNRTINRPEANAIVKKVVEICDDPRHSKRTIGVVVLQGEAQANLIESQLLERLGAEEMAKRRLVCGNPYSFQGDERDIIFLSMVAAPNMRIGPLTKAADERRFNVAASRARDQMYLFHSVTCNDLSSSCLRSKLLDFFENTKPQEIAGINRDELERKALQDNRAVVRPPAPFDSWFEVDVALEIARRGFVVKPQFEVAGKQIDLVIEGGNARLAVECDGDEWHGADSYEDDMQRQRMLERCRWEFVRIRESAFYANKEKALEYLWQSLEERSICPITANENPDPQIPLLEESANGNTDNIEDQNTGQSNEQDSNQTIRVLIGSTVRYINEEDGKECQALITTDSSNPDWGTINSNTPIARALLYAEVGEVVIAHLPMGQIRLKILEILNP